ncbi:MAG: hypothetical protein H5T63_08070, partial [Chloroflexi bacterium]|nr:hypothetical protein [Chloroflexota bacterium]
MRRIWLVLVLLLCLTIPVMADPSLSHIVLTSAETPPAMLLSSGNRNRAEVLWNIRDPRERIRAAGKASPLDRFSFQGDVRAVDLLGNNFPIANFADDVIGTTELNGAVVAYNSRRSSFLVVWHGFNLATGFDLYAREVSATGTMLTQPYVLCQTTG